LRERLREFAAGFGDSNPNDILSIRSFAHLDKLATGRLRSVLKWNALRDCQFNERAEHMSIQWIWKGEANRRLAIYRPCECGCDYRHGILGVGYISASDDDGNGFSIWIEDERIYARFKAALRAASRAKKVRAKQS
jgi:hypothetical protein